LADSVDLKRGVPRRPHSASDQVSVAGRLRHRTREMKLVGQGSRRGLEQD
jgi:hypothetical protein